MNDRYRIPSGWITIGIYGDDYQDNFFKYNGDIHYFIDACRKNNITIDNYDCDLYSGSWEMDLFGDAAIIYSLVNNKIPGYHCKNLSEFIDMYEI